MRKFAKRRCETDAQEGDYVRVEGAVEERGFPIALHVEVLDKK